MGFPGHFKIPGHSGTDFKHRKAFSKIKKYYRDQQIIRSPKSDCESAIKATQQNPIKYRFSKRDKILNLGVKFPLFLLFTTMAFFVLKNFTNYYFTKFEKSNRQFVIDLNKQAEKEKKDAYDLFVRTAQSYLHVNKLDKAQSEFIRALSLDNYGKLARIGLTKTLIKKCKQQQEFCDEIKPHLDYLEQMKYLSKKEIETLEK